VTARLLLPFACFACLISTGYSQPPGGRPGGAGGRGRADEAFARRLITLDVNEDGGLSIKELPEHIAQHFADSDANKDGQLTDKEIEHLASHFSRDRMQGSAAGSNPTETVGGGRPEGPSSSRAVPGRSTADRSRTDAAGNPNSRGDGPGGNRAGAGGNRPGAGGNGPGRGGPQLTASDIVARAMTFDLDQDGQLDEHELRKFAEDMIARRGPARGGPARGGPPGGGAADRRGPGGGAGRFGGPTRPPGENGASPRPGGR
tara:strand:- start:609698 stop:610477 length:780 start_codon:yes stop_codon:yes gene_type:complete